MLTASIIRVMTEAVSTSTMSVSFYQTAWHNIPEDSYFNVCMFHLQKLHTVKPIISEGAVKNMQ
jgi:hypothetical protein